MQRIQVLRLSHLTLFNLNSSYISNHLNWSISPRLRLLVQYLKQLVHLVSLVINLLIKIGYFLTLTNYHALQLFVLFVLFNNNVCHSFHQFIHIWNLFLDKSVIMNNFFVFCTNSVYVENHTIGFKDVQKFHHFGEFLVYLDHQFGFERLDTFASWG